ncbi:hypothetical protein [Actinokineospora sp. UTMC 2448]|uniref:hypothetical protein n=1 Tax=Actinokineospora sp. UTMC 2448 TaxID=2268449 RepID=UPI002164B93E|nr:hypothetical protein [Actinokineospora sp. UTMC 2448]
MGSKRRLTLMAIDSRKIIPGRWGNLTSSLDFNARLSGDDAATCSFRLPTNLPNGPMVSAEKSSRIMLGYGE